MPEKKPPKAAHDPKNYRPAAAQLAANRGNRPGTRGRDGQLDDSGEKNEAVNFQLSGRREIVNMAKSDIGVRPVARGTGGPVSADGTCPITLGRLKRFTGGAYRGMGWLRDYPDRRDSNLVKASASLVKASERYWETKGGLKDKRPPKASQKIADPDDPLSTYEAGVAHIMASVKKKRPSQVDNSAHCSPVEDQGELGSCTAFATVGMVEYMERRAYGSHVDASQLFLYKVTRNLMGSAGDTGAYLRDAMKAMVLFGVPPAESYPYHIWNFDIEPASFLYSYAANFKSIQYLRLDGKDVKSDQIKENVLSAIAIGYAATFGFSVFPSLDEGPDIPVPDESEAPAGGHAVLAVGYDDNRPNWHFNMANQEWEEVSKGALLIRNSWGTSWGDHGYGWLPYEFIDWGLADDFWICLKQDWVNLATFS